MASSGSDGRGDEATDDDDDDDEDSARFVLRIFTAATAPTPSSSRCHWASTAVQQNKTSGHSKRDTTQNKERRTQITRIQTQTLHIAATAAATGRLTRSAHAIEMMTIRCQRAKQHKQRRKRTNCSPAAAARRRRRGCQTPHRFAQSLPIDTNECATIRQYCRCRTGVDQYSPSNCVRANPSIQYVWQCDS